MPRVLLVDDEKNILKTLSMGLRRLAYGVEEAHTGPEALKLLEKHPVDVVVSDIRMSPMDGYTLATEIQKRHPQIPVILMSAYGFESQQVEEKDGVVYPKLTKPFSVHQLVEKLKEVETIWNPPSKRVACTVLIFSDPETLPRIEKHLSSAGLQSIGTDSTEDFVKYLDHQTVDCFLIDEQHLDEEQWKVLNEIDTRAPKKPVLLLVKSQGRHAQHTMKDLGVTMLDRDTFFKDHVWLERYIQTHLAQNGESSVLK